MDIRGLQLEIKKGIKQPLYMVIGEDLFLKNEAERLIKDFILSTESGEESNQEVYFGSNIDFEKCLDSLHTLPLFSSEKFIHIKEAEKLNQNHLEALYKFFNQMEPKGLTLLLSFSKADKRKKALKDLLKIATDVEVKTPYDSQLTSWVDYIAKLKGVNITAQAKAQLAFMVGPSLYEVAQSLDKLSEVFKDRKIDLAEVSEVVQKTRVQDIFQICDLIGYGKIPEALQQTEHSILNGQSPIGCLQLFFRHFRILEIILKNKNSRISAQDLAVKAGVPKFFLGNYQKQAQGWSLLKLSKVFKSLEAADISLKSTRLSVDSVFSAMMLEIYGVKAIKKGSRMTPSSLSQLF